MAGHISETRLKRVKHLRASRKMEKKGNRVAAPLPLDVNWMPKPALFCFAHKFYEFNETWRGKHSWSFSGEWSRCNYTPRPSPPTQTHPDHCWPRGLIASKSQQFVESFASHRFASTPAVFFWPLIYPGPCVVSAGWNFGHAGWRWHNSIKSSIWLPTSSPAGCAGCAIVGRDYGLKIMVSVTNEQWDLWGCS